MNRTDLIAAVAASTGLAKKDVDRMMKSAIDTITASLLNGEKVQLSGFGSFEVKEREARIARNPKTGDPMELAATCVPVFKPSKALKDTIAECKKQ